MATSAIIVSTNFSLMFQFLFCEAFKIPPLGLKKSPAKSSNSSLFLFLNEYRSYPLQLMSSTSQTVNSIYLIFSQTINFKINLRLSWRKIKNAAKQNYSNAVKGCFRIPLIVNLTATKNLKKYCYLA